MTFIILSIGTGEIIFIIFVALMLFGSKRLPEMARGLAKGLKEVKKVTEDIKKEIISDTDLSKELKDFKDLKDTFKDIK